MYSASVVAFFSLLSPQDVYGSNRCCRNPSARGGNGCLIFLICNAAHKWQLACCSVRSIWHSRAHVDVCSCVSSALTRQALYYALEEVAVVLHDVSA